MKIGLTGPNGMIGQHMKALLDRENIESVESIGAHLIDLCDSISSAFCKVNGYHVGACIKFMTFAGERPHVLTLVRDRKSSTKNRKSGKNDKTKHWLDSNSDFHFIYSNFDRDNVNTSYYYQNCYEKFIQAFA